MVRIVLTWSQTSANDDKNSGVAASSDGSIVDKEVVANVLKVGKYGIANPYLRSIRQNIIARDRVVFVCCEEGCFMDNNTRMYSIAE